jgi:hypothetical protein
MSDSSSKDHRLETRVVTLLEESLSEWFHLESKSILSGVSERNLCGGLAIVFSQKLVPHGFGKYHADLEYNRKQNDEIKTILDENYRVVTINCDLIVHSRGESISHDNLIAIEMKKSNRPIAEKNSDRARLRALTKSSYDGVWSNDGRVHPKHVCGYKVGLYLEINRRARRCLLEYYHHGHLSKARVQAL